MSDFWSKKGITNQVAAMQPQPASEPVELDQEALAKIQEEEYSVFEEEDQDMADVLSDANLRLEQGRLYQMIMNHDIFGETDADPKAIKNVQREIRRFARERMETMLGMRIDAPKQEAIVSSPFNDMEVTVLKLLASKMSKGATETQEQPQAAPVAPKKDGITAIGGSMRPKAPTPLKREVKAPVKTQAPKPQPKAQAPKTEESGLKKPIDQMTPQELLEHDQAAIEQNSRKYAKMPTNMVPMPTGAALEALYTVQASNAIRPGGAAYELLNKMGKS